MLRQIILLIVLKNAIVVINLALLQLKKVLVPDRSINFSFNDLLKIFKKRRRYDNFENKLSKQIFNLFFLFRILQTITKYCTKISKPPYIQICLRISNLWYTTFRGSKSSILPSMFSKN